MHQDQNRWMKKPLQLLVSSVMAYTVVLAVLQHIFFQ